MRYTPALPTIYGETLDSLTALLKEHGHPAFRARQVLTWLYKKRVKTWEEMTDLSRPFRAWLAATFELEPTKFVLTKQSEDVTDKLLLELGDKSLIETVIIRAPQLGVGQENSRKTICISTQVGCAMGCKFCASGLEGLKRNLSAGEIVHQLIQVCRQEDDRTPRAHAELVSFDNLVVMGMGEPLHNYDQVVKSLRILTTNKGAKLAQRRITVSTAGLVPKLEKLGREDVRPNLAVSLNAPNDAVRDAIMPINRKWNIAKLLGALRAYPLEQRRRITFEYVLLAGVNDSLGDAAQLAKLLRGIKCKVNIIPFNPHPEAPYARPSHAAVTAFQDECKRLGMPTYLRTPRGDDIDAACGQLANRSGGAAIIPLRVRKGPPPPPPVE